MHESQPVGAASRSARALLLCGTGLSSDDRNIGKVLDFFGVPWTAVAAGDISGHARSTDGDGKFCILASGLRLAEALSGFDDSSATLPPWITDASSVYVYGFHDTEPCRRLLRLLTGDPQGNIRNPGAPHTSVVVTSHAAEMAGPLSGMRVSIARSDADRVFELNHRAVKLQSLIGTDEGELFLGVTCRGVRFYLNACSRTVDLSSPAVGCFDVKQFFCSAVPITMYVKWAFSDICWSSTETSGCLIVDDPPLKPRYGFLHFQSILKLMDEHNFTTTIAFIPWNWRRTNSGTVRMLRQRPDRFSLCVHGCDHTAGEFAARSTPLLNRRIKAARRRMEWLLDRTALQHDRIMVFPQGAFSPETGRALKLNGFVAAVNTEVAPAGDANTDTTIGDLWSVAIMKYGTFPIFTRRYLTQGIENFAFDALLGKPCLIVAHHDAFKAHGLDLVDFIAKLNSLNWTLRWRPLGDAVTHTFKRRRHADGTNVIQMCAQHLTIENPSTDPFEVVLLKEEGDWNCVKAVMINQMPIDFSCEDEYLRFELTVPPKQTIDVQVVYFDNLATEPDKDGLVYKAKTCARRYLSELRDNYLSRSEWMYENAIRIKRVRLGQRHGA